MYTANDSSTSSREDRRGPREAEVDSGIVITQSDCMEVRGTDISDVDRTDL